MLSESGCGKLTQRRNSAFGSARYLAADRNEDRVSTLGGLHLEVPIRSQRDALGERLWKAHPAQELGVRECAVFGCRSQRRPSEYTRRSSPRSTHQEPAGCSRRAAVESSPSAGTRRSGVRGIWLQIATTTE